MATLATYFRRSDLIAAEKSTVEVPAADGYSLRRLPGDDIYFFCKRIDNSRLVRQAEAKVTKACWSTIGTACVLAAMLGLAVTPRVSGVLAGYRIEKLKQEQNELQEQRRALEIEQATLLSPARLQELAAKRKLAAPVSGQEVHLQPKDTAAMALITPTANAQ